MFYRFPRDVNNHQKQQKSLDVEVVCEFHKRSKKDPLHIHDLFILAEHPQNSTLHLLKRKIKWSVMDLTGSVIEVNLSRLNFWLYLLTSNLHFKHQLLYV